MMRKKTRLTRSSKQPAFSLLEACLAVLVTAIAISLSGDLLSMLKSFEKQEQPVNQLALSYLQLDRFLKKGSDRVYVDLKNSDEDKVRIVKEAKGKVDKNYLLTTANHRNELVLSGGTGKGNMRLLRIWSASFEAQDGLVKISITEPNKNYSKLYLKLDKTPKDDEQVKSKEETKNQKNEQKSDDGKSSEPAKDASKAASG